MLHVGEVPVPELAPDEVFLAVMASSINFNTVWTSIFEPLADVRLSRPDGEGSRSGANATRWDYHVVGSDAAGVMCARARRYEIGRWATASPCTATT